MLTTFSSISTTSTMTVTAATYSATLYSQCSSSSNNFAGSYDGSGITGYEDDQSQLSPVTTGDTNQEACCNTCAANPYCAGSLFYGPTGCINLNEISDSGTGQTVNDLGVISDIAALPDSVYVVSNGNAGEYTYGFRDGEP